MIYDIISNVLIALGIFYCAVVGAIFLGLFRNRKGRNNALSMVSVIVAARNEEENIEDCLSALALQDYPDDMYEVVVVNDRSSDGTEQIARSFEDRYYNFSLLNVTGEPLYACPKKNALNLGIESSRGEIILLTDADCRPPCSWISDMVGHFEPEVGLVAGVSPLDKGKTLIQKMAALESLYIAALSAGSIGVGVPISCAGRNLGYRKEAFIEVCGFDKIGEIISGDDVLFLRLLREETDWKIIHSRSPGSFVPCGPPPRDPYTLFNQKLRHSSKAAYYSTSILSLGVIVYLFHLLLFLLLPLSIVNPAKYPAPLYAFGMKACVDFVTLSKATRLFGVKGLLRYFPLVEILHIPYIALFGLLGYFMKFQWKEKKVSGEKVEPKKVP